MNSSTPSASTVAGAAIGIPLAVILVWLAQTFLHVTVPPDVSAAGGALLSALVGYFANGGKSADTTAGIAKANSP